MPIFKESFSMSKDTEAMEVASPSEFNTTSSRGIASLHSPMAHEVSTRWKILPFSVLREF